MHKWRTIVAAPDLTSDAIDQLVGAVIRVRRKSLGLSQAAFAEAIGVSFQQVQKYERGNNRVSASMLWRMAGALQCEVADLFESVPDPNSGEPRNGGAEGLGEVGREFLGANGGLALARAYLAMSESHRRAILAAARAIAEAGAATAEA